MLPNAPFFLALRYLRPKRSFVSVITLISVLGVMLGVGVLVVVMSVFKGWQVEFKKMLLGFEPHILLIQDRPVPPADSSAPPPFHSDWREVLATMKKRPGVASAVPVAAGTIVAEHGGSEPAGVEVFGLDDDEDNALVKKLSVHLKEGAFDLDGDNIILSDAFAKQIGAKVGDTIVVNAADNIRQMLQEVRKVEQEQDEEKRDAAYDDIYVLAKDLKLVGLLRSDTAGARAYVPLNVAQELFKLESDVTGIELELHDPDKAIAIATELFESEILPVDWTARTWGDEHATMLASVENQQTLMYFLLLFIMLVAAICVMNTTITVTVQKRREIGILTALGSRARQIIGIFLSQAAVVAVLGIVLGLIGGSLVLHYRNDIREFIAAQTGRDIFPSNIYFLSSIPAEVQVGDLASICGVAVVLCLLAALIPAWFAAKVDPAVALRD